MNTITINIPEGFEIDTLDKKTGQVTLKAKAKPKNVIERIKTVDDVLADHGLTADQFDKQCKDLTIDERAYRIIKMLAQSLNEDWTPDWSNPDEYKYYPWFEIRGSSGFRFFGCDFWLTDSDVGSRLCYKSRELAEHAGKNFTEVYKQFMVIE